MNYYNKISNACHNAYVSVSDKCSQVSESIKEKWNNFDVKESCCCFNVRRRQLPESQEVQQQSLLVQNLENSLHESSETKDSNANICRPNLETQNFHNGMGIHAIYSKIQCQIGKYQQQYLKIIPEIKKLQDIQKTRPLSATEAKRLRFLETQRQECENKVPILYNDTEKLKSRAKQFHFTLPSRSNNLLIPNSENNAPTFSVQHSVANSSLANSSLNSESDIT